MVRRLYSWGFQQLVRLMFDLDVRDTQTGIKVLRREVLEAVLPLMVEQRFAFDLELLVVARRLGFDRFAELPVRIERRFGSTISVRAVARHPRRHVLDLVAPAGDPPLRDGPSAQNGRPLADGPRSVRDASGTESARFAPLTDPSYLSQGAPSLTQSLPSLMGHLHPGSSRRSP